MRLFLLQVIPQQGCASVPVHSLLRRQKSTTSLKELHRLLFGPSPSSLSECLKSSTSGRDYSSRQLDPPSTPSPVRIPQRQLHQRREPDTHDYPKLASRSYKSTPTSWGCVCVRVRACVQRVHVRGRLQWAA